MGGGTVGRVLPAGATVEVGVTEADDDGLRSSNLPAFFFILEGRGESLLVTGLDVLDPLGLSEGLPEGEIRFLRGGRTFCPLIASSMRLDCEYVDVDDERAV